ncbi:hypothetical protein ACFW34_26125 [Streptomyces sp. NPDC058848]|uniref:hypothetical protein n=1 Tax=unclassified Streptomyces TaxID=2593676 RepID=UPI0036BA11AA
MKPPAPLGESTYTYDALGRVETVLAHVYKADDWEDFTVEWVRAHSTYGTGDPISG